MNVRKALAWKALNDLSKVWKSSLQRCIKISFFQATVESVLLYGCESWTLKASLDKSLDGSYTRILRVVLNIDPHEHITNEQLYSGLPRISDRVAARRMKLAGHCYRHQELPASKLVLWEPKHGHRL